MTKRRRQGDPLRGWHKLRAEQKAREFESEQRATKARLKEATKGAKR